MSVCLMAWCMCMEANRAMSFFLFLPALPRLRPSFLPSRPMLCLAASREASEGELVRGATPAQAREARLMPSARCIRRGGNLQPVGAKTPGKSAMLTFAIEKDPQVRHRRAVALCGSRCVVVRVGKGVK